MSRLKSLCTWTLLAFAWVTLGFWWGRSTASAPARPAEAAQGSAAGPAAPAAARAAATTAFYFHGDTRCATCNRMEAWTREAIEQGLAPEVEAGRLSLEVRNMDQDANADFVRDFELTGNVVVLARRAPDGAWAYRKLGRIWDLASDHDAFVAYLRDETTAFLRGAEAR